MSKKVEFGDFQTPLSLAKKCTELISSFYKPNYVVEPTCGLGYFLEASVNQWGKRPEYRGYEINSEYIDKFEERCPDMFASINVEHADFFTLDLDEVCGSKSKPLVIGNPPWVTNSQLGVLNSKNLPEKSNIKKLSGFDALSGKSNFDISEWMIIKLTEILNEKSGVLAMLCKTSVARNVFQYNYKNSHENVGYKIFRIDSKKEFDVSVDACLFICDYSNGGDESVCDIYDDLSIESFSNRIGISEEKIVADIDLHKETKPLVAGSADIVWRSGVKHDASKVMELTLVDGEYLNGFKEIVDVESDYVYPLLKSSDLANNRLTPRKFVIVTQKKVGDDTSIIKTDAPKLWKYLNKHSEKLDGRKSSIYKSQPRFSMFGIGDYSFKPYKIAISGLYKKINFCLLEPFDGKTFMLDDTCYMLGFDSLKEAKKHMKLLKSNLITDYISSLIFWDAKRPINSDILKSIDFNKGFINYSSYESPVDMPLN